MNLHPLSELERDLCLVEDVISDAGTAWALVINEGITPRSLDRLTLAKARVDQVQTQVRDLQVGMHKFLTAAAREVR